MRLFRQKLEVTFFLFSETHTWSFAHKISDKSDRLQPQPRSTNRDCGIGLRSPYQRPFGLVWVGIRGWGGKLL